MFVLRADRHCTKSLFWFCAAILLTVWSNSAAAQSPRKAEILELNAAQQKDFRSNSIDVFSVRAPQRSYVEIVLEQKGVDVSLAAISPRGNVIRRTDAPTEWFGRETLVFATEEAGTYEIEVRTARPGNFAGNYEIRLNVVRPLDASDKSRLEAYNAFSSAYELLRNRSKIERTKQVVAQLKNAAAAFNQANDVGAEAAALLWAGIFYHRVGLRREALEAFTKSLNSYRQIGDRAGEAAALAETGLVHHYLLEQQLALSELNQAIAIRQSQLDRLGESSTLTYLCRFYNNTGEFQPALEACRRAVALRQDGDPAGAASTLNVLGIIHASIGDNARALFYFQQAAAQIPLAGNYLNPQAEAAIWANMGGVVYKNKQYSEALEYENRALKIVTEIGNQTYQVGILRDLSDIYRRLKQYPLALEHLRLALKIYDELNLSDRQDILNIMGNVYAEMKQTAQARTTFLEAIRFARLNADRYALGDSLYNLAKLESDDAQLVVAENYLTEGIKIYEYLRAGIVNQDLRTAFVTENLRKFYELQINILLRLHELNPERSFAVEAFEAAEKSRARTLLEIIAETGADVNRSTDASLLLRRRQMLDEIGSRDEKLLRESRTLKESERAALESEIRQLSTDFDELQEEIRRKNPAYAALSEPKIITAREIQTQILDSETALVEYSLGAQQSYAWVMTNERIDVFKLPPRAQINHVASRFYELLSSEEASAEQQSNAAAKLSKIVFAPFANELENRKRLVIVGEGALQYVPFSVLPSLKLRKAKANDFLGSEFEIIKLPSISTLAVLRNLKKTAAQNLIAVMADPVFSADDERIRNVKREQKDGNDNKKTLTSTILPVTLPSDNDSRVLTEPNADAFARLPFSMREAEAIRTEAGTDKAMLAVGLEATRERILAGELENYRVLHFATHGIFNSEKPEKSGLALSFFDRNGKPVNGFLRAQDVYALRLKADLVVLSACRTAYGKEVEGEGLISLTRSFMYAGAPRVVASLWKVDDAATAEFMRRFYHALFRENKTASAALHQAQAEMRSMKRWQNPRYWASFVLQGDWR